VKDGGQNNAYAEGDQTKRPLNFYMDQAVTSSKAVKSRTAQVCSPSKLQNRIVPQALPQDYGSYPSGPPSGPLLARATHSGLKSKIPIFGYRDQQLCLQG
jgi:hypothetical protein